MLKPPKETENVGLFGILWDIWRTLINLAKLGLSKSAKMGDSKKKKSVIQNSTTQGQRTQFGQVAECPSCTASPLTSL